MSASVEREFVMKHVVTDYNNVENWSIGNKEYHFNVPWKIKVLKHNLFSVFLECMKFRGSSDWSIEAAIKWKIPNQKGTALVYPKNIIFSQKKDGEQMLYHILPNGDPAQLENYLADGNLTIEMQVKITKMTGMKRKLSDFDESMKEFADVVLIVNNEKFNVSRKYLAYHSAYFKSLLMGSFDESKQSEIALKDVEPYDFQNFLEVLHGEPSVDEDTIDGILHLADMYDSKTAIRQCEKFLLELSRQSLKVKFEMAIKYKMENLKKKCLSKIKTGNDICSVLPEDIYQFDQSVYVELIRKAQNLK